MPIRVDTGGGMAAPIVAAGFGAGQGKARSELERQQLEMQQQQENALGLAEHRSVLRANEWEFRMTRSQQLEVERNRIARQKLMANPDYSEEEKRIGARMLDSQLYGLSKPIPMPKKPLPDFKQNIKEDDYGNVYYVNPETGEPKYLRTKESKSLTKGERMDFVDKLMKQGLSFEEAMEKLEIFESGKMPEKAQPGAPTVGTSAVDSAQAGAMAGMEVPQQELSQQEFDDFFDEMGVGGQRVEDAGTATAGVAPSQEQRVAQESPGNVYTRDNLNELFDAVGIGVERGEALSLLDRIQIAETAKPTDPDYEDALEIQRESWKKLKTMVENARALLGKRKA